MPYPFDFERKGVLDLELLVNNKNFLVSSDLSKKNCFLNSESSSFCSVLDSGNFPSGPSSHSALPSSLGGSTGGGSGAASTDTVGMAAVSDANPSPKWPPQDPTTATSSNAGGGAESELLPVPPSLEIGTTGGEKCAMEDWRSVLSESVADSPEQEQSIFRWIMGDVEDPVTGSLSKVLELGGGGGCGGSAASGAEYEFNGGGFGIVDHGFGGGDRFGGNFMPQAVNFINSNRSSSDNCSSNPPTNFMYPSLLSSNIVSIGHLQPTFDSCAEMKPTPIFNPQLLVNQHQAKSTQNPTIFIPQTQGQNSLFSPQAKRHNPSGTEPQLGGPVSSKGSFSDTGLFHPPHQLQFPHYLQQRPMGPIGEKRKMGDEVANFHQQEIIDQLYKASELVQAGNNLVLVQAILARLNHQLSPIGKPFHRSAYYFKEALQLLVHLNNDTKLFRADSSPFSLIFKISAYKFFSEISPVLQFANFTCTQALIEEFDGFGRIHIVDFDIGYGGQWASLMQELAIRPGVAPSLKITVLASPSTHDQLELCLTRENLVHFASEINISFEFDILSMDCLNSSTWSLPFHVSDNEAVAVNLPISSLSNYQVPVPLVFRFVKQLCPRVIVSIDRGCDRTDLPFSSHIIHALQSYTNLLESFDAMNVNMDALQNIERFLVQPGIEKIVMGRFCHFDKTQHWRTLFLSSGFSPVTFSNFTESQAEFLVKGTPVRGFQVEKRQSSLVLCWQQKELISVSAWRCLV